MFNDDTFQILPRTAQVALDESKYSIPVPGLAVVNYAAMDTVDGRQLASRADDAPSDDTDADWGEQDSLANIPRKTRPSWIRALSDDGQRGDK